MLLYLQVNSKALFVISLIVTILDCELMKKFIEDSAFGRRGARVMMNEDPNCTFNLLMAQICFCLWELVDSLNLIAVPKDPQQPVLSGNWLLSDFVPQEVSPSSTSLSVFLYCSS